MKAIHVAVFALPLLTGVFSCASEDTTASAPAEQSNLETAAIQAAPTFAPTFKAPFPCGQQWTFSHHSAEVRRALDFIRTDGGSTNGTPNLASAAGTAYRYYEAGGAGNYVVIDHGSGWKTYYFHLSQFSISHGQYVEQGQQIGLTGATGNVTGPHIHYEQLYNGVGQNITINGSGLPYPGQYYQNYLTSDNGCGGGGGKWWVDTFAQAVGYNDANMSDAQGELYKGTNYVYCKVWGKEVRNGDQFNHWWLRTDLDVTYAGKNGRNAYVSAYYLAKWGNDEAKDNNGTVIPDCP
ncbi:M23 family metallopeptidase [Pendulispora brunnea]|uniref:M23 family metallopeptidase n=1 Tax=Pendulispora brunnea TaxID=2905690 RepID=A0ABZ2KB13_9BACT